MDEPNAELQLLTRHLSGISTRDEETRLEEWLSSDPTHPRVLDALRSAWEHSSTLPALRYDPDSAWTRVAARIHSPGTGLVDDAEPAVALPASRRRAVRKEAFFGRGAWRAAAVALLVAGSGLVWHSLRHEPSAAPSASLEVEVPRGQEATVRLPDGSRVVLAPESRLRYPRSFGDRARELHLEGMAYFEVTHDAERPFLVHAGGGTTRVLGTKFVVRAYPNAPRVEVAVAEGKVSLRADSVRPDRAVALTPGQVGRLDPDGVARLENGTTARLYLGWMDGQPVIHDLTLTEALAEIERWYDVKLAVGDSTLASRRITTTIERSSLTETLAVIALALDARYVRRGDTLVFLHNH